MRLEDQKNRTCIGPHLRRPRPAEKRVISVVKIGYVRRSEPTFIFEPDLHTFWREGRDTLVLWIGDNQPNPARPTEQTELYLDAWIGAALAPPAGNAAGLRWLVEQIVAVNKRRPVPSPKPNQDLRCQVLLRRGRSLVIRRAILNP